MTDEQLNKYIEITTGTIIRLQAQCHALETVLMAVAVKLGLDKSRIEKAIHDVTETAHQKLLEKVENLSPSLAAQVDLRGDIPDIPDSLL